MKEGRNRKTESEHIRALCKPLGEVLSVALLRGGNVNRTYRVTLEGRLLIVRIFTYLKKGDVARSISLLTSLKKLPIPKIVSIGGKQLFSVGGRPAIVYEYIWGDTPVEATKRQCRAVGAFLGRFHSDAPHMWDSRDHFYDLPQVKKRRILNVSVKKQVRELSLLRTLLVQISEYELPETLPSGPIHVDVKPGNTLFKGDALTGVIDFDNAYRGPYLLDLAKTAVWFGLRPKGKFDFASALAVIRGYQEARRVTKIERAWLYKALHFAFMSHIIMDYYMFAKGRTNAAYFKYITGDFYNSYRAFANISEERWRSVLEVNKDHT